MSTHLKQFFIVMALSIGLMPVQEVFAAPKKQKRSSAQKDRATHNRRVNQPRPTNTANRPESQARTAQPATTKEETFRSKLTRYAAYALMAGASVGYVYMEVRSRLTEDPADIEYYRQETARLEAQKNRLRLGWDAIQTIRNRPFGAQDRPFGQYPYELHAQPQDDNEIFNTVFWGPFRQQYETIQRQEAAMNTERTQRRWISYLFGRDGLDKKPHRPNQERPRAPQNPFGDFFRNFENRYRPFNGNRPNNGNQHRPFGAQDRPFNAPQPAVQEPDPHQVLGIGRDATRAQIIRAYRDQALLFHPDRYEANREQLRAQGINTPEQAAQRMAQINQARDVLIGQG